VETTVSDPSALVALVGAIAIVTAAWISRPTRETRRNTRHTRDAVQRVESQFTNNGGSSMRDALDRIERGVTHLGGRFDQHVTESTIEKQMSHAEQLRMWSAIEAVAKSEPPHDEGEHDG
jgi:hypothetical protein